MKELIKQGKKYFIIEAEIVKDLVAQTLKIYFDESQKKAFHNSNSLPSFTSLLGIIPSVIHSPSDIDLITGQPSLRRRFMNLHLAQIDPLYVLHLSRFFKALKQRNFLLKTQNITSIDIWEHEMAKSAAYITQKRERMIAMLNEPTNQIMQSLSNKREKIILRYTPALATHSDLKITYKQYLQQLEKNRKKDLMIKTTSLGPHRDDFICYIDNKPARIFASQGQIRCLISSLKLSEYNLLCQRTQSPAIMNIDDIGMHLDEHRQNNLKSLIKLNQVFITIPNNENIWHEDEAVTINIKNGMQQFSKQLLAHQ